MFYISWPPFLTTVTDPPLLATRKKQKMIKDGPFDIQGGEEAWDFFEQKIVCFPTGGKK